MKFENTDVWGFEHALTGMRNPMNSWNKSDSDFQTECYWSDSDFHAENNIRIGKDDLRLARQLIKAGSEHRKFMRQIFVSADITAPLYWWKEFDTYKIGTVSNSCSTMHKLAETPITMDCFEIGDYDSSYVQRTEAETYGVFYINDIEETLIPLLEELRCEYLKSKDKHYWKELIRWLPESWLQKRTVTMNYENIYSMIHQRQSHRLNEWSGCDNPKLSNFVAWAKDLPYSKELLFLED